MCFFSYTLPLVLILHKMNMQLLKIEELFFDYKDKSHMLKLRKKKDRWNSSPLHFMEFTHFHASITHFHASIAWEKYFSIWLSF